MSFSFLKATIKVIGVMTTPQLSQLTNLVVFIPENHLDEVKQALFSAGAGTWQGYDQCCWQTKGNGQFRPLVGSQPYVGQTNMVETVTEYRVEMLCSTTCLPSVINTLKQVHPYEVPAFYVFPMLYP